MIAAGEVEPRWTRLLPVLHVPVRLLTDLESGPR